MGSLGGDEGKGENNECKALQPLPFRMAEIRAAIPKHCWAKDARRSLSYVVRDVLLVSVLAAVASCFDNWVLWPIYWAAQGTMFWALFVLGQICYKISDRSYPLSTV